MYPATYDIFNCFGAINMTLVFILTAGLFLTSTIAEEEALDTLHGAQSNDLKEKLVLTKQEEISLEELKAVVLPNITRDFLRKDFYLLRVLQANKLDVKKAGKNVLEFQTFLWKNNLDTILSEDFSDLTDFPYHTDAVDNEGRPVVYVPTGKGWNIRRAIQEGKRSRLIRFSYRVLYEVMMKLCEINLRKPNVTQFVAVANLEGFNIFRHSCPSCIRSYRNLFEIYERFIPGFTHEVIVFNAPEAYRVVLEILRPSLSEYTSEAFRVFGRDKGKWKKYLESRIDTSQLPWESWDFDGKKPRN